MFTINGLSHAMSQSQASTVLGSPVGQDREIVFWRGGILAHISQKTHRIQYLCGYQLERAGEVLLKVGDSRASVLIRLGRPVEQTSRDMEFDWPEHDFALRITFDSADAIADFRAVRSHPEESVGAPREPAPQHGRPGRSEPLPDF